MIGLEEKRSEDYESGYDSELYIFPKEKKYEKLAKALEKFLYSADHDAIYFNGKTIMIAIDPTKPIKEL